MSVHFIIDGYNLINTGIDCFPSSIRSARRKLIKLIEEKRPQGSVRNKITVIFDGQPGITSPPEKKVRVIYTEGAEADDYILREVLESANPPAIITVTDDKALRKKVKSAGAKVMAVNKFMLKLFGEDKKPETAIGEKKITEEEKSEINRDLEKKWNK